MGIMKRKKKSEIIANPLAVLVCTRRSVGICEHCGYLCITHHNSVIPSKDGKLIESCNQIPPRSDVAGYEDAKSKNREGVHESLPIAGASQ